MPPKRPPARVAILIVNGFDKHSNRNFNEDEARHYPWIALCLEQIARHTKSMRPDIYVWDNSLLPEHLSVLRANRRVRTFNRRTRRNVRHGPALDKLLKKVPEETEFIVTLDSDAFPIRHGWLNNLIGRLTDGATLAGVWRDEVESKISPYVHPSCLAVRRSTLRELQMPFRRQEGMDVAHNLTVAVQQRGGEISRLRRSNHRNLHYLMAGIYGDLVYHQGAGSRNAIFRASADPARDEELRIAIRNACFTNVHALVDFLAGDIDSSELAAAGLPEIARLAEAHDGYPVELRELAAAPAQQLGA